MKKSDLIKELQEQVKELQDEILILEAGVVGFAIIGDARNSSVMYRLNRLEGVVEGKRMRVEEISKKTDKPT